MAHRIFWYNFWENGQGDKDVFYWPICDGRLAEKDDVRFIVGQLWNLHKEGKKPIIAIFLPEGDEMDTNVDQETGEIKDGEFSELNLTHPLVAGEFPTSLVRVDPIKDAQIQRLLQQLADVERWANSVVVASLDDDKSATNDLVIIAQIQDGIKERTAELVKPYQPYLDEVENIKSMVKKLLVNPLSAADVLVRGKILSYRRKKKDEVQQVRGENLAIVHEALAQAEVTGKQVKLPDTLKPTGTEPPKTVRSEMGSSTTIAKRAWSFKEELTHEQIMAGLPTQYKMANISLINDAVRKNKQLGEADFGNVIDIYPDDGLRINKRKVK